MQRQYVQSPFTYPYVNMTYEWPTTPENSYLTMSTVKFHPSSSMYIQYH